MKYILTLSTLLLTSLAVLQAAETKPAMVQWTDFLPTLVDAAGGKAPADIDGRSFLPVLRGETTTHRDRIFTTHSNDSRFNVYPMRAVRSDRWKYIRNLHPDFAFTTHIDLPGKLGQRDFIGTWEDKAKTDASAAAILKRYHERPADELYDLQTDPHEQHNLAADPAHAAELQKLRSELDAWIHQQSDTLPLFEKPRLLIDRKSYGPDAEGAPANPAKQKSKP